MASVFITSLLAMLILAVPLFLVAGRRKRMNVVVRFVGIALLLALLLTGVSITSNSLVQRCEEAGNNNCVDYGGAGVQFLIVASFAVASWVRARKIVQPF